MMTVRQSVKLYPSCRLSSVFILVLQVVGLYYCMFFSVFPTINDVFQSCRFYDVPGVLTTDAMSSQALAEILE